MGAGRLKSKYKKAKNAPSKKETEKKNNPGVLNRAKEAVGLKSKK